MINEQIALVETLLTNVEMVAFALTSNKRGNNALAHLPANSHHSVASTASSEAFLSAAGREGNAGDISRDLIDFEREENNGRDHRLQSFTPFQANGSSSTGANNNNNKASGLSAITEALNTVESLRMDIEKMQMGIQLLTLSVTKLMDIVQTQPTCCSSVLEFFALGHLVSPGNGVGSSYSTHSNLSSHSNYRVQINRNIAGNYTTTTNNILHQQQQRALSSSGDALDDRGSASGGAGNTVKKSSFNFSAGGGQHRKKGYENLASKNFTIEGMDDYED
jgi:hypothetical protein